jgi:hypothetical protein
LLGAAGSGGGGFTEMLTALETVALPALSVAFAVNM